MSLQEILFCFFLIGKEKNTGHESLLCCYRAEMKLNKCTASVYFFVFFFKGVSINNYFYKAHFSLQSFIITVINFFKQPEMRSI